MYTRRDLSVSHPEVSFKDILLVPYDDHACTIRSRNDPDISSEVVPNVPINIPLISSPMDSVTGPQMMLALDQCGALGIHTRYINKCDSKVNVDWVQAQGIRDIRDQMNGPIACALGVKFDTSHVYDLIQAGVTIFCVDIQNANHILMRDALAILKPFKSATGISIIAGNVATPHAAHRLIEWGADGIKIGIGPGAACTTRRVTGFGVPQFAAIMGIHNSLVEWGLRDKVRLIADGGCRNTGDFAKALWAGADTVMCGWMFAGHDECPMPTVYRGMSSRTVSQRNDVAPEGIDMELDRRGPVANTVNQYAAALRSALSMANAMTLEQLRNNVHAIRVSTLTQAESDPLQD